jgi:hypothetical protein
MMAFLDWTKEQSYYGLAIAGGLIALLSTAFYFAAGPRGSGRVKVPSMILGVLGGVLGGVGLGVLLMTVLGYQMDRRQTGTGGAPGGMAGMPGKMPGGFPPGKMPGGFPPGKMPGGFPGGFPGGGFPPGGNPGELPPPPSSKEHLADLVDKLDHLTGKPLQVRLSEKEGAVVAEQLRGLGDKDELSEDEAGKRLNKLLTTLKGHKAALRAAGFTWPGEAEQRVAGELPNPFREGEPARRLKALQQRFKEEPLDNTDPP